MPYAQFYHKTEQGFVEGCGDRSIIWIDGRLNSSNTEAIAKDEAKKRGYNAYALLSGTRLLTATPAMTPKVVA